MEIKVSVICNTYNHEKYIRDALEGFLMQKTDFDYEILIHDDASTDKTADIIREYEKKYPELIKPIYQSDNKYSKGISIGHTYQFPRAVGKYIAVCEGDDYWIDPYKLQKQYDAMEQHPELDMCAHQSQMMIGDDISRYVNSCMSNRIFAVSDVISGGGGFVSTNSLFYRKEINDVIPEFRKALPIDYTLQIQGSLRGGMLYLNDCMSIYRYRTPGSWTDVNSRNIKLQLIHHEKVIKCLEVLNKETDYAYEKTINDNIKHINEQSLYMFYCYDEKKEFENCDFFKNVSVLVKLKLRIRWIMHNIKKLLKNR